MSRTPPSRTPWSLGSDAHLVHVGFQERGTTWETHSPKGQKLEKGDSTHLQQRGVHADVAGRRQPRAGRPRAGGVGDGHRRPGRRARRGADRRQLRPLHRGQAGVAQRHQGQQGRQTRAAGRPQPGAVRGGRPGLVDEDRDIRTAAGRARGRRRPSPRSPLPRPRNRRPLLLRNRRPPTAAAPPPPPPPRTYTVVSGDTLWAISERFYGDGSKYQVIADASGVANPDLIHPGQVLTIPYGPTIDGPARKVRAIVVVAAGSVRPLPVCNVRRDPAPMGKSRYDCRVVAPGRAGLSSSPTRPMGLAIRR